MSKKLKIRFVKFEKALTMQILEQEGSFRNSAHIQIGIPELYRDRIYLCDKDERYNLNISVIYFYANANRDEYLNKVIRWISEEQFTEDSGELKVGEMCEVKYDESNSWEKRKLIAILPEQYNGRFIVEYIYDSTSYLGLNYARPITKRAEPKIEECGQLITYTWEEK